MSPLPAGENIGKSDNNGSKRNPNKMLSASPNAAGPSMQTPSPQSPNSAVSAGSGGGNPPSLPASVIAASSPVASNSPQSPPANSAALPPNVPLVRSSSNLAIDNRPWTLQEIGQNHIASLLNDPTLTGQNASSSALLAHKLDTVTKQALAAIPKTQIKQVKGKDFEPYLNRIKDAYDKYVELLNRTAGGDELSIPLDNFIDMKQMTAGSFGPKFTLPTKVAAEPIESIPKIFFEQDFNLENPQIFDQVTEFANVASATPAIMTYQQSSGAPPLPGSSVTSPSRTAAEREGGVQTTNAMLQEKLSHYLDTVEMHLVAEISKRSVEFFSALSNIQSLHKETIHCLADIRVIRSSLAKVAEEQAKKGLSLVRKRNRRNNLTKLYDIISMVKEVKKTQPMIQVLLSQGDYVGSLDLIAETNRLLKGRPLPAASNSSATGAAVKGRKAQHERPVVQLNSVRGLVHLSGQLAEMAKMIGNLMENDLIELLGSDLDRLAAGQDAAQNNQSKDYYRWAQSVLFAENSDSTTSGPPSPAIASSGAPSQAAALKLFTAEELRNEEELRSRMVSLIYGLVRTEKLSSAIQLHRDAAIKTVKAVTKQFFPPPLPSEEKQSAAAAAASGGDPAENSLAKRFRVLSFDEFFKILVALFSALLQLLRRIALIHELLCAILKDSEKNGIVIGSDKMSTEELVSPSSPQTPAAAGSANTGSSEPAAPPKYSQLISESAEILLASAEYAHVRCGKLLTLRAEQNSQLNFKDFFKLFDLCWRFVVAGEAICQRTCIGLRGTVMSQAKLFLNYFHMERMKQLSLLISNEPWLQTEIPVDFQKMANKLTHCTKDNYTQLLLAQQQQQQTGHKGEKDDDEAAGNKATGGGGGSSSSSSSSSSMLTALIIGEQSYAVVSCVLLLIKMLEEYMVCVTHVPNMAPDVLNRLVELLRAFNSRVCAVIVGGAAVQSQVLKSITAKHLALAGQSLECVRAILPGLRQSVEEALPRQQKILAGEFDKVSKDFESNIDQVFKRITMIMSERLQAHCEAMTAVKWDPEKIAADSGQEPNAYMRDLVKETVKLYRILRRYLFQTAIRLIFTDVFQMYGKRLEQEFSKVEIYTISGKSQLLADVKFYIANLSSLEFVDGPGNQLEVVVNNVRVRERPPAQLNRQAPPARPFSANLMMTGTAAAKVGAELSMPPQQPPVPQKQKEEPPMVSRNPVSAAVAAAAVVETSTSLSSTAVSSEKTLQVASGMDADSASLSAALSSGALSTGTAAPPPSLQEASPLPAAKQSRPTAGDAPQTTPVKAPQPAAAQQQSPPKTQQPAAPPPQTGASESAAKKLGSAFSAGLGNFSKFMSAKTAELTQKATASTAVGASSLTKPLPQQQSLPQQPQATTPQPPPLAQSLVAAVQGTKPLLAGLPLTPQSQPTAAQQQQQQQQQQQPSGEKKYSSSDQL